MIVFRKQESLVAARQKLESLVRLVRGMKGGRPPHASVVDFLIEFSEFESAVVDALAPERDGTHPAERALRSIALLAGDLFCRSWTGGEPVEEPLARIEAGLGKALRLHLPDRVCLRVSEGYVHYGISPETYIEAAEKFCREVPPSRVVCIGIRSIGAGLSAVVGAVLRRHGFDVDSFTLRPRGHPFARIVSLTPELEKTLAQHRAARYLVVDEGPGLSGSSLCSTARRLSDLGIGDERIAFFPCWEPDGEAFVSGDARKRWMRHRKYSGSFEEAWIHNGRLAASLPCPVLRDISAGRWREMFYGGPPAETPAVHPHHEQRKYLCTGNGSRFLAKFAGLGRYGKKKYARMERLFASGLVPEPIGLVHGFLVSKFQEGRPFTLGNFIRRDLVQVLAGYLARVRELFPAEDRIAPEEMRHMIRINVLEGLGEEWAGRIEKMDSLDRVFRDSCPTEIDGRMFPHEWLSTERGYIKTDSVDHHADQFFPRSQDSAWDVAGTCIEFGFDRHQRDYFINRYQALTKDQFIRWRLPSYSIAYSAFRLGYAVLSADSLAGTGEALKFRAMAERYRTILKRLILLHG